MWPAPHAQATPDKVAYVMAGSGEAVTYRQLDDRSNQSAQLFRSLGLGFGDHVAFCMHNGPRFLELAWAAQRSGLRYTTINWHFNADEVAYILEDCGASVLVADAATGAIAAEAVASVPTVRHRYAVDGTVAGFADYVEARDAQPAVPIGDEVEGAPMLYSSGTTGRPKGIRYPLERQPVGETPTQLLLLTHVFGMGADSVYLSPTPLYHAAPLFYCISVTRLGGTVVVMERFDPEEALALVERHRVTHSQWVPTMFVRMLKLPPEVRDRYDLSSHRCAIHAAAPCPVEVKRQMIEWWGPILEEYYSATEGLGATYINSADWSTHPGSVGTTLLGPIHICDDDGNELPAGEVGTVWFEPVGGRAPFEYHNDAEKTRDSYDERGWATVGDMGYLDDEGYLYLTDRKTFMIISGGVNIYPQEIEDLLVTHPSVADVAVFGVPDPEMGEAVKAVVQPTAWDDAGPDLERELLAFCRSRLAHYKCPRSVDFDPELPRQPTGKLYKRLLRDRYWGVEGSRIV